MRLFEWMFAVSAQVRIDHVRVCLTGNIAFQLECYSSYLNGKVYMQERSIRTCAETANIHLRSPISISSYDKYDEIRVFKKPLEYSYFVYNRGLGV